MILGSTLPMLVSGISVLAAAGGGLYWLVPELILGYAGAIQWAVTAIDTSSLVDVGVNRAPKP